VIINDHWAVPTSQSFVFDVKLEALCLFYYVDLYYTLSIALIYIHIV
jgi:hypothetical protein